MEDNDTTRSRHFDLPAARLQMLSAGSMIVD
jgi:hypothetical protein